MDFSLNKSGGLVPPLFLWRLHRYTLVIVIYGRPMALI